MRVTELKPMLWTEDVEGTLNFYSETLGFAIVNRIDELGWASLALDDAAIMISRPNEHIPYDKIGFTGSFYFGTDDADAIWNKIKDKVRVCYDIEDFDYGMREFAIYDNNGYLLQFGQEIAD